MILERAAREYIFDEQGLWTLPKYGSCRAGGASLLYLAKLQAVNG